MMKPPGDDATRHRKGLRPWRSGDVQLCVHQLGERIDAAPGTIQPADDARVKALEARLEAVESARYMRFLGPHDPGVSYGCGAVTLRSGSAWVALTPTTATPGSSSDWRRLGKDATE